MCRRHLMLGAAWFALTACGAAWSAAVSALPEQVTNTYSVTGIVKKVRLADRQVVVQHEAVPGYMPAMTMPFKWKGTNAPDVKEGDSVTFRLLVTEDESWIDQVTSMVARPASVTAAAPAAAVAARPRHPMMEAVFTNELNQPVRLADFQGQALAITFFFTRCPIPDYCPRLSKNFETASHKLSAMSLSATNWHFLSISFDPTNDTPAVLKSYGERYDYDPRRWSFWTGPAEQVAELARLSDVTFQKGPEGFFDHNFRTLIIDPAGKLQMSFPIGGDLSEAIVSEMLKALSLTNKPS